MATMVFLLRLAHDGMLLYRFFDLLIVVSIVLDLGGVDKMMTRLVSLTAGLTVAAPS